MNPQEKRLLLFTLYLYIYNICFRYYISCPPIAPYPRCSILLPI